MRCREAIAEAKPFLVEAANIQFPTVEIPEEFFSYACETATMQIRPYRLHQRDEPHIAEMIVDDEFQVFIYRENGHGIEVCKDVAQDYIASESIESVVVKLGTRSLFKLFQGYEQHWRIE